MNIIVEKASYVDAAQILQYLKQIGSETEAQSKEVFAVGAVNAAVFLAKQGAGMYSMSDLLADKF